MENQQNEGLMWVLLMLGGVNIILSILGGVCLATKYEVVPSMLGMPVSLWGLGGYSLLIILYFFMYEFKEKIMIIMPLFFIIAIVYGTSGAMGISFGVSLACPFCRMVWIVNIFILTALIWELVYVRVPVFFDQEEW